MTPEALSILGDRPIQVGDFRRTHARNDRLRIFQSDPAAIPGTHCLLLTGYADLQVVIQAINQGHIYRYITKPWGHQIRTIVRDAYQRYQMTARNQRLLEELRERADQLEHALLELSDSEQLYRRVVENINDPIAVTDLQARILSVNPAFTWANGDGSEEVIGRHLSLLASDRHPDVYTGLWRQLLESGRWRGFIWSRRNSGGGLRPTADRLHGQ